MAAQQYMKQKHCSENVFAFLLDKTQSVSFFSNKNFV